MDSGSDSEIRVWISVEFMDWTHDNLMTVTHVKPIHIFTKISGVFWNLLYSISNVFLYVARTAFHSLRWVIVNIILVDVDFIRDIISRCHYIVIKYIPAAFMTLKILQVNCTWHNKICMLKFDSFHCFAKDYSLKLLELLTTQVHEAKQVNGWRLHVCRSCYIWKKFLLQFQNYFLYYKYYLLCSGCK